MMNKQVSPPAGIKGAVKAAAGQEAAPGVSRNQVFLFLSSAFLCAYVCSYLSSALANLPDVFLYYNHEAGYLLLWTANLFYSAALVLFFVSVTLLALYAFDRGRPGGRMRRTVELGFWSAFLMTGGGVVMATTDLVMNMGTPWLDMVSMFLYPLMILCYTLYLKKSDRLQALFFQASAALVAVSSLVRFAETVFKGFLAASDVNNTYDLVGSIVPTGYTVVPILLLMVVLGTWKPVFPAGKARRG